MAIYNMWTDVKEGEMTGGVYIEGNTLPKLARRPATAWYVYENPDLELVPLVHKNLSDKDKR